MAKNKHYYIRKAHRYLGVLLGLQFLLWTISGLYFSWTNIDEIHGDFEHKPPPHLSASFNFISPTTVIKQLPVKADSIDQIQVVNILQKPFQKSYRALSFLFQETNPKAAIPLTNLLI